jgi:hypothetical protein
MLLFTNNYCSNSVCGRPALLEERVFVFNGCYMTKSVLWNMILHEGPLRYTYCSLKKKHKLHVRRARAGQVVASYCFSKKCLHFNVILRES